KVVVQNVIDCTKIMINPDIPEAVCFITRLDPSESYFIDSITLGNGFIVADVDVDFVNLSMNRSIKELRENDAVQGKKLIEVLRDLDAEHSVVYATPYPPFFND
ncbi:hypothetical protein S83_035647, partial [Arachis hypogaea]